jgi:radical SAM protein with 4Fe4S-binding SPASM domain
VRGSALIDYKKLQDAYDNDGIYALQLEIGDICHQGCIYCYMNAIPETVNQLQDEVISAILEDSRRLGISAIEWLGGEPLLRKSVFSHMTRARELGLQDNMWTGGLPLEEKQILKQTADLCRDGLIAFHLSTINPEIYKFLHPDSPGGNMEIIIDAVKRLLDSGYPSERLLNSVTFTGLQTADDMIETIDYFEENFGIKTSLNVYHTYLRPGTQLTELERFIPSRKEVARVYKRYNRQYGNTQLPMNCVNKQYCSATVAVLCDGSVTGCATIREQNAPRVGIDGALNDIVNERRDYLIFKNLKNPENLPAECKKCGLNDICWGCRSRAYAAGYGIEGVDPRCFRTGRRDK